VVDFIPAFSVVYLRMRQLKNYKKIGHSTLAKGIAKIKVTFLWLTVYIAFAVLILLLITLCPTSLFWA